MHRSQYQRLFADIDAQIAASGVADRQVLRQHRLELQRKADSEGVRVSDPRCARAEQDRIDDAVEAQFDNLPV
ncbi:hypothetical protein Q4577_02610 [Marinovum sp. 2_MG-2023]|uniref:hypothetical protein n=1 Tax=Roseobacteraceae TaxID=2854170 RepID=UPI001FCFF0B2|nr:MULTISPECIES: hypothetical protein [Roseobacteraceae]MCJ7874643.1 hypothetical protein [Phaeobacter sp. J2-8]MDO6728891.1 hypothetical protein [Marinovum sp. 2_MG-2023]MDO6777693.1 hypothetical protein [Marinovum sp. 1_MG-2023]